MDLKKLLNSLTLEEKIGQLTMIAPHFFLDSSKTWIAGPLAELGISEDEVFLAGSVLGIGNAEEMIEVQKRYLEKSRHKIPLIFMADIIHGYETIFPVPLALASSFNDEILFQAARVSAKEAKASGIHATFSPMVDLVRDPRWGRVVESYGEDPYMLYRFANVQVKAYQGRSIKHEGFLASCVKHFAAYGLAEGGKDYNTVDLSRLNLHQYYLKGYKGAIDAKAKLVMTSFNIFEGIPATTNQYLLKEVLRKKWKFKGTIISDYASLKETISHGTEESEYSAAVSGVKAGLNIEMATALYMKNLKDAVKNGDVSIEEIDELVMSVLKLKEEAGLFENPFIGANPEKEKRLIHSKAHIEKAYNAAVESMILLKNNHHVLPIRHYQKVALIGPYTNNPKINGPWSWHGDRHVNQTLYEAFKKSFRLVYSDDSFDSNIEKLKSSDVIVMAMGESQKESGEAHSKSNIKLDEQQIAYIKRIKALTGKPIVLVLFNGRPLDLSDVVNHVDAILEAYFPGTMGSKAIAHLLSGKQNPSGKLTMSFPRSVGQVPIYYNHLNTGRPYASGGEYVSHYLDLEEKPLFPFGYGLSYSNFKYENVQLSSDKMKLNETLTISVDITNDSYVQGKEVVQLYLRDHVAKVSRPVKELINFKKIDLAPNETKKVIFEITKKDLEYYDHNLNLRVDPGKFSLFIGPNSEELIEKEFILE